MSTAGLILVMFVATICIVLILFAVALVLYARHPDNNRDDNASFTWGDET